jgi:hypothetical protein
MVGIAYRKPEGTSVPSEGFFRARNNFNVSIFISEFYADDRKSMVKQEFCKMPRRSKCLDCVQV